MLLLLFLLMLMVLLMWSLYPPHPGRKARHDGPLHRRGHCPQHLCSASGDEDDQTTMLPAPQQQWQCYSNVTPLALPEPSQ